MGDRSECDELIYPRVFRVIVANYAIFVDMLVWFVETINVFNH